MSSELTTRSEMQMISISESKDWYNSFVSFTKEILKKDLDYGVIPNTPKPSLYKPGAEKLRFVYGLGAEFENVESIVNFDRMYIDYTYKCTIKSKSGQVIAQCEGNCNSMEAKFGWLWKPESELPSTLDKSTLLSKTTGKKMSEFSFSIDKAETSGQYGKPQEYWDSWKSAIASGRAKQVMKKSKKGNELEAWEMDTSVTLYRIQNPDVIGNKNTIMKMAQKRAFVGAILLATGASEFFTQDIEDMEINGQIHSESIDVEAEVISVEAKPIAPPKVWVDKISKCNTFDDLKALYDANQLTINAHKEILDLFTNRKNQIKNEQSNP